jgi:hypothetical protein
VSARPFALAAFVATGAATACTPGPVGVASLPPNVLTGNLLAHWTFDEGGGFSVGDSSGNMNDGLISGNSSRWISDGRFGGALHLDSPDQFGNGTSVTVGGFPQATSGFTVSAWYRLASVAVGPTLAEKGALLSNELLGGGGWVLNLNLPLPPGNGDANYEFGYWTGPGPGLEPNIKAECRCLVLDEWVHLAAVVDAAAGAPGTVTLYVNGVAQTRVTAPSPIARGLATLYIGRWPGADHFLAGDLDDIAIWSRVLVPAELALLRSGPVPNPL